MSSSPEAILRGGISLPRTSSRKERDCYVKLLSFVDAAAENGFGFEGIFFRAGAIVSVAQLRPNEQFPEIPVVLEYMPGAVHGEPGERRRRDQVYILWRYEWDAGEWRELARAASESWQWAIELRPVAVRALQDARSRAGMEKLPDLPAIARRIALFLDGELKLLDPEDRVRVIGVLHDQFASRLVA